MTTYQKSLHHTIHGPDEPLPIKLSSKSKTTAVDPLRKDHITQLPQLPSVLLEEQKSLTGLRAITQVESHIIQPSHPASNLVSPTSFNLRKTKTRSYPTGLIRKHSSELLLNSDPEAVMTRYFPPLESLADPLDIVDRLKREPELGFLYLTPVEERQSVKYNPYNLK